MKKFLTTFAKDERGVSALEYAVLAGAVGATVLAVFGTGAAGDPFFDALKGKIDTALGIAAG